MDFSYGGAISGALSASNCNTSCVVGCAPGGFTITSEWQHKAGRTKQHMTWRCVILIVGDLLIVALDCCEVLGAPSLDNTDVVPSCNFR